MRVLDIYGHAAGGLLANGLAFAALFAAIPTTLLMLGVGGWITSGNPEASDRLANALIQAFPPLAELINGAVDAMSQGAALTSLIGVRRRDLDGQPALRRARRRVRADLRRGPRAGHGQADGARSVSSSC